MPRKAGGGRKARKSSPPSKTSKPLKPLKYEPLSPNHWDKLPPPVDQGLWRRYMNEEDSDSDISDSEQENSMAGPLNPSRPTESQGPEQKPKSKNEMVREVLDDSFNTTIHNILNGIEDATTTTTTTTSSSSSSTITSSSKTSHHPHSPNCHLPILQHPRMGLNSRPPPDPAASYCANEPAIVLAGHDVHGNAFPGFKPKAATTNTTITNNNNTTTAAAPSSTSTSSKTTNTTKSEKKKPVGEKNATGAGPSSPTTSSQSSTSENPPPPPNPPSSSAVTSAPASSATTEYPIIRTPHLRCPNPSCGQYKAVNVMAKHLDICLLGKGRRAGREARERMKDGGNGIGSGGTATPNLESARSRAGTPSGGKREREGREGETEGDGSGVGKKVRRGK